MSSLRQTRPFSTATAHSTASHSRDPFYDTPSRGSDPRPSSNTPDLHEQQNLGNEGRAKSLRKAKSNSSVKSVQFEVDRRCAGTGTASPSLPCGPLVTGSKGGYESGERIKKQAKGKRSQSARPRDHNPRNDDQPLNYAHKDSPNYIRESKFDARKTRSRSRSPYAVPGSSGVHIEDVEESSFESYTGESYKLNSDFGGSSQTQYNSQGTVGDILEELSMPKQQRSKLRAPRSRTASPAPSSALSLLNYASHASPPLARKYSVSPLPIHSCETTYNSPDSVAVSSLASRAKPQSRIPQVNPNTVSSPSPLPMVPRTLRDVTRYLGQNRETHYSSSDSDSRYDNMLDDFKSKPCYSPNSSLSHNAREEVDSSMKIDPTEHCLYNDTHHRGPQRSRYGLALTSESGHVLGEQHVTDIRPQFSSKRAVTPVRSIPTFASKSRKTLLASSSESLSESNAFSPQGNHERPGAVVGSTSTIRVSADRRHVTEKNTAHISHILPNVASQNQGEMIDRRQLLNRHEVSHLYVLGV